MILSIDQSTQGTKGLVWGLDGALLGRADVLHTQIIDSRGWVSHDLEEIWRNVRCAAAQALEKAGAAPGDVRVIGISNQRETACCWDKTTGRPLAKAVVWQCGRAASITEKLAGEGWADTARAKTGLQLSPYFSAPKYRWMVENIPAVKAAQAGGTLCCGTVDSYLLFKMTRGRAYKTDYSNASRTGLLNLDTLCWDADLMRAYGLTIDCLPELCFSDSLFGETTLDGLLPRPVPIHGVLGDSHAALFAHHCVEPYTAKVTYGTGSSIMMNAGTQRPAAAPGVVTSLAWGMNGQITYCVEGNINYTGAVITWLVQDMKLLERPALTGEIAASLPDNGGVYLVPAFSGLGAPYFNNAARAAILGMGRSTTPAHIVRAAEECIAYQISDVVAATRRAAGRPLAVLCADGGPTKDEFLMQFQADMLGLPLAISRVEELSGEGAAYCAAIGGGFAAEAALFAQKSDRRVLPQMADAARQKLLAEWKRMLQTVAGATAQQ